MVSEMRIHPPSLYISTIKAVLRDLINKPNISPIPEGRLELWEKMGAERWRQSFYKKQSFSPGCMQRTLLSVKVSLVL